MPHVEIPHAEFKVVLLGETNTGKTSLVLRFVEGNYKQAGRSSTVGAFFLTKRLTVNSLTCKLLLWDTAGQEQFQKLAKTYYKSASAVVLCYDVSNPRSLVRARQYLQEVIQNTHDIVICVVGCKTDLEAVPGLEDEARKLAESVNGLYLRTSAKNNTGVSELFHKLAASMLHNVRGDAFTVFPEKQAEATDSSTANDSDDHVVDDSEDAKKGPKGVCEGSLLVCGTDERSCCIM